MKHTPSKVIVYQSTDYNRFVAIDGNRSTNKKKIERIKKDIKSGNDFLDEKPILVREAGAKLEVIDGQHRLEIDKDLGRPVHYIIHKQKTTLLQIAKINSNTDKWKDNDFINCYVKAGNANYKVIKNLNQTYGISVGVCLHLLYNGYTRDEDSRSTDTLRLEFQQGTFEVRKKKEAFLIAETCKNFEECSQWNSRAFIKAICVLMEKDQCEFDRLLKKFQRDPRRLQPASNYKEFLASLENIYNLDNQKRIPIY